MFIFDSCDSTLYTISYDTGAYWSLNSVISFELITAAVTWPAVACINPDRGGDRRIFVRHEELGS